MRTKRITETALVCLACVFGAASCVQGTEMTPEADGVRAVRVDGPEAVQEEAVLDTPVAEWSATGAFCDDVEWKDLQNIGILWGIGCGWIAGSTLGAAIAGPVGAGVGGALGAYIGAHDPWLQ